MRKISRILIGVLLVLTIVSCSDISLKGIIAHAVNAAATPPKVLLVIANPTTAQINNMVSALAAYSDIASVTSWDSSSSNPTLAQLKAYDVVLLSTDWPPFDNITMSNNLAQYLDGGGRVVLSSWDWAASGSGYEISGSLLTQYSPFQLGMTDNGTVHSLGSHSSSHPIMNGVTTFSGVYRNNMSAASGATTIASWDDGVPLVGEKGHVIGLDFGIQYTTVWDTLYGYGWQGDGWTLLHNAVLYIWHKL